MPSDIGQEAAELLHQWLTLEAAFRHKVVATLDGLPRRKAVDKPATKFSNPCQALVNALFEEAIIFHGAVPQESRQPWLKSIEACKGKIPDSEYDRALAILRAGS